MNYQVLARKWRPQRFADVVGQQHVLTALINALSHGRLHHAYLFSGTRGVGKTSIARLLAKALNCDSGITPEPCGVCGSCLEIEQGRFVDLLEIDAASRTKVEDTRELLDNVQYQPARGRFKVYLIDEVHMLSRHSFNALLKTLEEPPPHVKFLLATTDPQKLPITILSRCLQFHLKSLDPSLIDGQLQHILQQEQLPFEAEATAALSRAADGSLRDALSLTDQALAFGNGEIKLAQVESMLGNLNRNQLLALIEAILTGDGEALLARVSELASLGPDYDQIHKELIGFWHQLALAQVVPAQPLLPYAGELNRLAPLVPGEHIQLYYQICLQGRKDLPFAPDGRSALEMTLLRTLAFRPQAAVAETAAPSAAVNMAPSAPAMESAPFVKKPEPPRVEHLASATPQADADAMMAAQAMAAQLYQEQDTILAQAAHLGHQPAGTAPAQTMPAPAIAPSQAVPNPGASSQHMPGQPVLTQDIPDQVTPAAIATPALSVPAEQSPAPVHSGANEATESDTQAEAASEDPAAANVARIRRLLQTRNRLRSQDLDTTKPEPVGSATPTISPPAYTPPSRQSSPAQPPAAQSAARPGGAEQASAAPTAPSSQSEELPPLDAYTDMSWEPGADDAPPWLEQDAPAPLVVAPARPPSGEVSMNPPRSQPVQPAPTVAATPVMPGANLALAQMPAAHSATDAEPLKPSSLLPQAEDDWARLVAALPVGGLLRQLVMHSTLEQKDEQHWCLWLKPLHRHLLNDNARQALEAELQQHLGQAISLQIDVGEASHGQTPFEIEQILYQAAIAQAKDEIEADDAVQFLISRFAAELDRDSIEPMAQ